MSIKEEFEKAVRKHRTVVVKEKKNNLRFRTVTQYEYQVIQEFSRQSLNWFRTSFPNLIEEANIFQNFMGSATVSKGRSPREEVYVQVPQGYPYTPKDSAIFKAAVEQASLYLDTNDVGLSVDGKSNYDKAKADYYAYKINLKYFTYVVYGLNKMFIGAVKNQNLATVQKWDDAMSKFFDGSFTFLPAAKVAPMIATPDKIAAHLREEFDLAFILKYKKDSQGINKPKRDGYSIKLYNTSEKIARALYDSLDCVKDLTSQ